MKRMVCFMFCLLGVSAVYSQSSSSKLEKDIQPVPKIKFDNIIYDFGIIPYDSDGSHLYVYTNIGTTPLIITNCVKGCGCTDVVWTKIPVRPGQKGMVKATYNTKIMGNFSKGVDVYSNDPLFPKINLRLKGSVENMPENTDTPSIKNTSISKSNENKSVNKW
jgi:hypothetical protein